MYQPWGTVVYLGRSSRGRLVPLRTESTVYTAPFSSAVNTAPMASSTWRHRDHISFGFTIQRHTLTDLSGRGTRGTICVPILECGGVAGLLFTGKVGATEVRKSKVYTASFPSAVFEQHCAIDHLHGGIGII